MKSVSDIKQILNLSILFVVATLGYMFLRSGSDSGVVESDQTTVEEIGEAHHSSFAYKKDSNGQMKSSSTIDDRVNEYMHEVQRRLTVSELRSLNQLQGLGPQPKVPIKKEDIETDLALVSRQQQIWKDADAQAEIATNQRDIIQKKILEEQKLKQESEQAKRQYASEFIENARRSGYHITLSPNMEVLTVEPIRKPNDDYDSLDQRD